VKKHLLSITDRHDIVFKALSEELEISLSELFRRALDSYIEQLVKKGTLIRFTWSDGRSGKSIDMEKPKESFKKLLDYVKANPNSALQLVSEP
jgi:hypothetical protein